MAKCTEWPPMTLNTKREKVPHIDVANYPWVPNFTPFCSTTPDFLDIGIFFHFAIGHKISIFK